MNAELLFEPEVSTEEPTTAAQLAAADIDTVDQAFASVDPEVLNELLDRPWRDRTSEVFPETIWR